METLSVVRFPRGSGGSDPVAARPTLRDEGRRLAASLTRLRLLARRLESDGRALRHVAERLRNATRILPPAGPGL